MGRIEFPSTPINAKADAAKPEQNGTHPDYVQPAFDWLESEQEPLIELGNCHQELFLFTLSQMHMHAPFSIDFAR